MINPIKNPEITNSYSEKLFICTVDSFGIVGDRILSEFFNGFDDPLAVFGIEFFDEVPCGSFQKNLKHVRVPVLS